MGCYAREGEWSPDRLTPAVVDAVLAVQQPWITPVRCHDCPAVAEIRGFGLNAVYSRTDLWVHGWRRDPDTRLHYCPDHAGALACR